MTIETGTCSVRWLVEPLTGVTGNQRERERTLAHVLLCRLVGTENLRLEHNTHGAPYLPEYPDLHVSISHCRTAVAVAVSDTVAAGIDIESRRKTNPSLIERICTPDEQAALRLADDAEMAFLRLWTRKEAVLKCRGTGIRGFESMVHALETSNIEVRDLPCDLPDTVVALATVKDE